MRFANGRYSIVERGDGRLFEWKDKKHVEFKFPSEKPIALVRHDLRAGWYRKITLGPSHVLIGCFRNADNAYVAMTGHLLGGFWTEHDDEDGGEE